MRKKINTSLKEITRESLNISYVEIEEEDETENNWDDFRHINPNFLTYVLGKIGDKFQTVTGEQLFIKNMDWTTKQKYGKVKATYKFGCENCTETGHSEEVCQVDQEGKPKKKKGQKRTTISGSEESEAKKIQS